MGSWDKFLRKGLGLSYKVNLIWEWLKNSTQARECVWICCRNFICIYRLFFILKIIFYLF
jgi:hypothetical protein